MPVENLSRQFNSQGVLQLPHGVARFFREQNLIVIRPYYQLFSIRFRTAWPLKGTIEVQQVGQELLLGMVKRMPWTSALITMLWLGIVVLGTLTFVVMFGLDGGFQSAGGVFLALGIVALGMLVLAFGLVLLSLAYRLEDHRLMQVYQELQEVLNPSIQSPHPCAPSPRRSGFGRQVSQGAREKYLKRSLFLFWLFFGDQVFFLFGEIVHLEFW